MTAGPEYAVLGTKSVFRGSVLSLRVDHVRMSDGEVTDREVVEHLGAVVVAALDDEGRVVIVNQYRHPVGERLDELPAGLLDVVGESALHAAQRELAEEAGLTADRWEVLLDLYPSPGFSTEAVRIFLARGLDDAAAEAMFKAEHEEMTMTVRRISVEEAVNRVLNGSITNAAAVAGILAVAHGQAKGWSELRDVSTAWPARPER